MFIQSIRIDNILVEKGLFSLKDSLFESNPHKSHLSESFQHLGILSPVIVFSDKNGHFHLIDGIERIRYAKQNNIRMIEAIVLPETTPFTHIITLIFYDKRNEISQSIINKIQFIYFAVSLDVPEPWVLQSLCIELGFNPHSDFLRDCERINSLPKEVRLFCHEKRFSLKQILNLTYYPRDLLLRLMSWKTVLHLTASILDEIASNLRDYLKAENKTIQDFISEPGVQEILQSTLTPRERIERFRSLLYTKRFPILSEVNTRIQKTVEELNLPNDIKISWDKTLENRRVEFIIQVRNFIGWANVLGEITSTKIKTALKNILDEL